MKTINIQSINIESNTVIAKLLFDDVEETISTTISKGYINYVVTDRIDAYVWGLLHFAMNYGADIVSELPISDELYYNLTKHYIPTVSAARDNLKSISINAPLVACIDSTCEIAGTGISCGVDSLYTIKTHTYDDIPESHRINTLAFFNAGSSMKGGDTLRTPLVQGRLELAEKFAKEYGFKFLFIETDIHLLINRYTGYDHVQYHTMMMLFCTYHLQSVIGKYYYSSGYTYNEFNFGEGPASYDLFNFFNASIGKIKFYSTGAEVCRLEKTKALIDYEPAHKFLNVCVEGVKNDSTCFKCVRTMLTLDGLKALDNFNNVFNVLMYRKNRFWYLKELYTLAVFKNDNYMKEIFPLFKDEFTFKLKLKILLKIVRNRLGIK